MAYVKLKGRAKLEADLAQLKVKVKQAQDKLNATTNGVPLKPGTPAYIAANTLFENAIKARDTAQAALDNYKEPEKSAKVKSAKEIEAERQKALIDGPSKTGGDAGTGGNESDLITQANTALATLAKQENATNYINNLSNAERLAKANQLKAAGYNPPITGEYNSALVDAYISALSDAQSENTYNKSVTGYIPNTLDSYLAYKTNLAKGTGGNATEVGINISSDTDAQSLIQSTFKSVLGREATAAELGSFAKQLNKAERAAGRKATKVGNRTTYTSDLNREQFLTNEIKKIVDPKSGKSEFETKKAEKEGLTAQSLQAVAKLNGINLSQAQLDAYTADIRNGKDINVIKNNIRQMAGLGRPDSIKKLLAEGTDLDTIYSPYKTTMASLLEIPSDQINLNDATLRSAIGPDKEMPLYDFRKALKKDARWQYTNNARKEVSDNVLRVLQDFGFQG